MIIFETVHKCVLYWLSFEILFMKTPNTPCNTVLISVNSCKIDRCSDPRDDILSFSVFIFSESG